MRFMFILLPSCFPIGGGPVEDAGHPIWTSPGSSLGQPRSISVDNGMQKPHSIRPSRPRVSARGTPATKLPYTRLLTLPNNFFAIRASEDHRARNFCKIEAK